MQQLIRSFVTPATGVLSDAKEICAAVKRVSPDTLTALDGVCSVGSEEIRMDDWGVDIVSSCRCHGLAPRSPQTSIIPQVIGASQKGLGVPPGLSVTCASPKAIEAFKARKAAPTSYFASWNKWLPIMEAYGKGAAAYFATPPVVCASHNLFQASVELISSTSHDPATYLRSSSFPGHDDHQVTFSRGTICIAQGVIQEDQGDRTIMGSEPCDIEQ